jgi:hypothetical protein
VKAAETSSVSRVAALSIVPVEVTEPSSRYRALTSVAGFDPLHRTIYKPTP